MVSEEKVSEEKVKFIPLFVGLLFVFFIGYIIKVVLPVQYFIYAYILIGITVIGIGFVIYFSIKNIEFREKTISFLKEITIGVSDLGNNVLKNMSEGERRSKKAKRVPIANKIKNKVYDIAGGKCQKCGKAGSLKIHHIDSNPSNNTITNLILLCGNHHDDADNGSIPKWRLKSMRKQQASKIHTVYSKKKKK